MTLNENQYFKVITRKPKKQNLIEENPKSLS